MDNIYKPILFPTTEFPILYKSYWGSDMNPNYRIKDITSGNQLQALSQVFRDYFLLNLDPNTISQVAYVEDNTPYRIVFILTYLDNGVQYYYWEYLDNFAKLRELNINNKI